METDEPRQSLVLALREGYVLNNSFLGPILTCWVELASFMLRQLSK